MESYLDYFPVDVLRIVSSNLDYTGRINLNRTQPPEGRVHKQLNPDIVAQIDLLLATRTLKRGLMDLEGTKDSVRHEALLHFFDKLLRHNLSPAVYNLNFRHVMLDKIRTFGNPQHRDYDHISTEFKNKLTSVCKELEVLVQTKYPFKKPLSTPKDGIWSPVDAGAPLIVEACVYRKAVPNKCKRWRSKKPRFY